MTKFELIQKEIQLIEQKYLGSAQEIIRDYNDENEQLDIDVDVDIDTDELSNLSDERINQAIDDAYLELDEYINVNYRE